MRSHVTFQKFCGLRLARSSWINARAIQIWINITQWRNYAAAAAVTNSARLEPAQRCGLPSLTFITFTNNYNGFSCWGVFVLQRLRGGGDAVFSQWQWACKLFWFPACQACRLISKDGIGLLITCSPQPHYLHGGDNCSWMIWTYTHRMIDGTFHIASKLSNLNQKIFEKKCVA